jgi:hypothetical protein
MAARAAMGVNPMGLYVFFLAASLKNTVTISGDSKIGKGDANESSRGDLGD